MPFSSLEDKITDYEILEGKFEELERKLSDIQEKNIQATETMSSVGRCRQRSKFLKCADFLVRVYTNDETRLSFILLKVHYLSICPFSVRKIGAYRKIRCFTGFTINCFIYTDHHTEKKLENEQQIWNVEKRSLNAERDHLKQRSEDLQQQNTLLHTQLTKLSTGDIHSAYSTMM